MCFACNCTSSKLPDKRERRRVYSTLTIVDHCTQPLLSFLSFAIIRQFLTIRLSANPNCVEAQKNTIFLPSILFSMAFPILWRR